MAHGVSTVRWGSGSEHIVASPTVDLVALLPAGEWAAVRPLNITGGMMAGGDWAVFAKAKWLREGGHQAFIKFIVPAGSHAGPKTDLITGGGRLARLASRLVHIKAQGDDLPVVRLLEVSLSSSGLLVAMEEVTPLKD